MEIQCTAGGFRQWRARTAVVTALAAAVFLGGTLARADLILSAPPRETLAAGMSVYGPLADFLSQAIGEKVEYRYPANWGLYQALMTKGEYDLIFDGPHFVSWRIRRLQHVPLAALSGKLSFVIIGRQDDSRIHSVKDLVGQRLCGHAPPNLATLTMLDQFTNPSRQPKLMPTRGFDGAYRGLLAGQCVGTVLPLEVHKRLEGGSARTRVLYRSRPYSNQALTAGPRVTQAVRQKIIKALLQADGRQASRKIATKFGSSTFVAVSSSDYKGYDRLLENTWGFQK